MPEIKKKKKKKKDTSWVTNMGLGCDWWKDYNIKIFFNSKGYGNSWSCYTKEEFIDIPR